MPNERIIAKMKLVKQNQKRMQSKAEHRRSKVIAKLEEQLAMAEALCRNEPFAIKKTQMGDQQLWGTGCD